MKRVYTTILALVLLLTIVPVQAFAAGKMTATQESAVVLDSWGLTGYGFIRLENTGDKPTAYSAGLFEIYDTNGDAMASSSYVNMYGDVLMPGEYGYARVYADVEDEEYTIDDVDDYALTVSGKSAGDRSTRRFPCTAEWKPDTPVSKYSTYNYMEATFTNETEETLFNISVAMALLDDDGNILYVDNKSVYNDIGITPGSSIVIRIQVGDDFLEANAANGITPTQVDAYAYIDNY